MPCATAGAPCTVPGAGGWGIRAPGGRPVGNNGLDALLCPPRVQVVNVPSPVAIGGIAARPSQRPPRPGPRCGQGGAQAAPVRRHRGRPVDLPNYGGVRKTPWLSAREQKLARQDAQFRCGPAEPAAVSGRKAPSQAARLGGRKRPVKGGVGWVFRWSQTRIRRSAGRSRG